MSDKAAPQDSETTWPRVVKLKHPFKFGDELVEELEFQRGKVRDAKGIEFGDTVSADQLMLIAARLCGRTPKLIEMLDVEDAGEAMDIALSFYTSYLGTGKSSSR